MILCGAQVRAGTGTQFEEDQRQIDREEQGRYDSHDLQKCHVPETNPRCPPCSGLEIAQCASPDLSPSWVIAIRPVNRVTALLNL